MVVTGDAEPFHRLSKEFTFNSAAAAIILAGSGNSNGFSMFRTYSYPEYSEELVSSTFIAMKGGIGKAEYFECHAKASYRMFVLIVP